MTRWRTITAFDADAKAVEVYRANMPGVEVRWEPVRASTLPRADVLLGGPPCQPFSVAGQRGGSEDARDCVPDFIDAMEAHGYVEVRDERMALTKIEIEKRTLLLDMMHARGESVYEHGDLRIEVAVAEKVRVKINDEDGDEDND